eukprot:2655330-Lingulodinium_polyedra.AAC.1
MRSSVMGSRCRKHPRDSIDGDKRCHTRGSREYSTAVCSPDIVGKGVDAPFLECAIGGTARCWKPPG